MTTDANIDIEMYETTNESVIEQYKIEMNTVSFQLNHNETEIYFVKIVDDNGTSFTQFGTINDIIFHLMRQVSSYLFLFIVNF